MDIMLKLPWVFILCLLHYGVANEEESTIICVHALFRHGERTTEGPYPTDPHINYTYYPVGLGQLTNAGKMQEYALGQWLRARYNDFLGDIYTDEVMEIRSTGFSRTRKSALLVAAGLWPPKGDQVWNDKLLWQPIPVDYERWENDDLLNVDKCPRRVELLNGQDELPEVQEKFNNPYKDLFEDLSEKAGVKIKNPLKAGWLYFILKTEESWNLTLPEWTKPVYPEPIYNASSMAYSYLNFHLENKIINTGYLLKKIFNDTSKKIDGSFGESEKKIFLYSGHESTIGVFLDTLDVRPHVPDYSSCIILEMHKLKEDNKYAVKLIYKPDPNSEVLEELTLKDCDVLCPFEKFQELLSKYIPVLPYKEACQVGSTTSSVVEDSTEEGLSGHSDRRSLSPLLLVLSYGLNLFSGRFYSYMR